VEYTVNDHTFTYNATGERAFGEPRVLLHGAEDLAAKTSWAESGFSIQPFLDAATYQQFHRNARQLLFRCWKKAGIHVPEDFNLERYHQLVPDLQSHLRAVEQTKLLSTSDFPVSVDIIEKRIGEICGARLRAFNPFDQQSVFHFRVIRPTSGDNNPLHRDVWLQDYDNCINLYIPIAGSNELSSLVLIPGSHYWPESRIERTVHGAVINNLRFNLPAVTGVSGKFTCVRPNPGINEVLIFSPYLIHGGAVNLNSDTTRISIELRLWKL